MLLARTTLFRRGKLPHWEIQDGRYFVTLRLADSLPRAIVAQLREVHRTTASIEAASGAFEDLQRRYFRTMEKYLNAGNGECALRDPRCAEAVVDELAAFQEWGVETPHYTIMPNHVHALIVPRPACGRFLGDILKRLKGRTAYRIRQLLPGKGPVWQREWFDRWMREDAEWDRIVNYIRENPVKAGLVTRWQDHAWTK